MVLDVLADPDIDLDAQLPPLVARLTPNGLDSLLLELATGGDFDAAEFLHEVAEALPVYQTLSVMAARAALAGTSNRFSAAPSGGTSSGVVVSRVGVVQSLGLRTRDTGWYIAAIIVSPLTGL